jgi:hypothetical protein
MLAPTLHNIRADIETVYFKQGKRFQFWMDWAKKRNAAKAAPHTFCRACISETLLILAGRVDSTFLEHALMATFFPVNLLIPRLQGCKQLCQKVLGEKYDICLLGSDIAVTLQRFQLSFASQMKSSQQRDKALSHFTIHMSTSYRAGIICYVRTQ